MASRILPGSKSPPDVISSSPVERTPTVGEGWTRSCSTPTLESTPTWAAPRDVPRRENLVARLDVAPSLSRERAWTHGFLDDDDRPARFDPGALDHAHSVSTGRQRCPCHDANRLACRHVGHRVVPCHHGADHAKARWGSRSVGRSDRVPVHGRNSQTAERTRRLEWIRPPHDLRRPSLPHAWGRGLRRRTGRTAELLRRGSSGGWLSRSHGKTHSTMVPMTRWRHRPLWSATQHLGVTRQ